MKKVLVIAGPTASGKSDFAVEMAEKLDAEIISGDSIQVYRGCDIGSGKVTEEEMHGIPHHLIDILSPKGSYSAADFQRMARSYIDHSPKLQIICGGTGLYLKSCLYDYTFSQEDSGTGTDPELEKLDNDTLYAMLRERDPKQAEKIHPHNRRRVLRSLTIFERTGKPQSELEAEQSHEMIYDAYIAGCTMERSLLYERIDQRVEGMFERGLEREVRELLESGVTFEDACMHGIGYQEFAPYFAKTCTIEDVKREIQKHSRQFAKRQYTWFNHQMPVHWFDPHDGQERQEMEEKILTWIGEEQRCGQKGSREI